MFANERYEVIETKLNEFGSVSVSDLAALFDVSTESIRRDLSVLEQKGVLKRVHGGAVLVNTEMKEFKKAFLRISENEKEKTELSQCALSLIEDKDIISIDSGSTAEIFARVLAASDKKNLTVITHSLGVFEYLKKNPMIKPILIGGEFLETENSFYGDLATTQLKQLHVLKAFMTPSAVSLEYGIRDYITELIEIQKTYMQVADHLIVLADSSKFEKTAFMKICESTEPDVIVTDGGLDEKIINRYLKRNVKLMIGNK